MSQENTSESAFTQIGLTRQLLVPIAFMFLVPVMAWAFFRHATNDFDRRYLSTIVEQLQKNNEIDPAERERLIEFYQNTPVSRIMASTDPGAAELQAAFAGNKTAFLVFRWNIRLAIACIVIGIASFLFGGIAVAASTRSQTAQYLSLAACWHGLKLVCLFQLVAQGAMAVSLSYWVTALWMNVYVPKLIIIVGLFVLLAVGAAAAALLKRLDNRFEVEGTVLDAAAAATLLGRITEICEHCGTEGPAQLVVGIDDNFFVTEHPVTVNNVTYKGRTLYLSLSLLRFLEKEEADCIIGHEMAHFSGNDTTFSRKTSPILGRYAKYLEALREGGISLPFFYFMLLFWNLFQASISRTSRQREFRADSIAVEVTSASALARSLAKTTAYSRYRAEVEGKVLEKDRVQETLEFRDRIADGFSGFIDDADLGKDVFAHAPPHPFDSHPQLPERLQAAGVDADEFVTKEMLLSAVQDTWNAEIDGAEAVEKEMWEAYEKRFREFHAQVIPYRLAPATDEEIAIVEEAFPAVSYAGKRGTLSINYHEVQFSEWDGAIEFGTITGMTLEESTLSVGYKADAKGAQRSEAVKVSQFPNPQACVDALNRYYVRFKTAEAFIAENEANRNEENGENG